jgi:hypothetical protein
VSSQELRLAEAAFCGGPDFHHQCFCPAGVSGPIGSQEGFLIPRADPRPGLELAEGNAQPGSAAGSRCAQSRANSVEPCRLRISCRNSVSACISRAKAPASPADRPPTILMDVLAITAARGARTRQSKPARQPLREVSIAATWLCSGTMGRYVLASSPDFSQVVGASGL